MNIESYITQEEMKEIAVQEFRGRIRELSQSDLERVVNNSAYQVVWSAVDECMDDKAKGILKEKVLNIINDMTFFNVFSKPNAWDRQDQQAYGVIMQTIKDNKDLIDKTVKEGLSGLTKKQKTDISYQAAIESLKK